MPHIDVLQPGAWTTVQDLGRTGHRAIGVPVAGAVDRDALRAANQLVGNDPGAAGLEMTYQGPVLRASCDMVAAVAGAPMIPLVDGCPQEFGRPFVWPVGAQLSFDPCSHGCRSYLALAGGIAAPEVLGSRSLDARGGFGGVFGRPLRAGDRLACQKCEGLSALARCPALPCAPASDPVELRLLAGPEEARFSRESLKALYSEGYRVTSKSNRMALMLEGPALAADSHDIISSPTVFGTVQVPSSGMPIILLADGQTTGGYARPAVLISADRPKAAQLVPGTVVRFRRCSLDEAREALHQAARPGSIRTLPDPETLVAPV